VKAQILVDEEVLARYDWNGNLISAEGHGKVHIKNPTENTTLWGIRFFGEFPENIKGIEPNEIPHVSPLTTHSMPYNYTVHPLLKVTEKIDTNFSHEIRENPNFKRLALSLGVSHPVLFRIEISNNHDFVIKNVVLKKQMPEATEDVVALEPYQGTVTINDEKTEVEWKIEKLGSNDKIILDLLANLKTDNTTPVKTGDINLFSEADVSLSGIDPHIESECDNADLQITVTESATPNNWEIDTAFINNSEYEVTLVKVSVQANGETVIDEAGIMQVIEPGIPEPLWNKKIVVESVEYPNIDKSLKYYVNYEVSHHIKFHIQMDETELPVLAIKAIKTFEPPEVNTYTRVDLLSKTVIENIGTAIMGNMDISAMLPQYFEIKDVALQTPDKKIIVDYKIVALDEGETENYKIHRKLDAKIGNLNVSPGQSVTFIVNGIMQKPVPNADYNADEEIKGYTEPPSLPHIIKATDEEGNPPKIVVKYKRRSYKLSSVYKALSDGKWLIEITLLNNGEVPIENIIVSQPIKPATYSSHEPAAITAETKGDTVEFKILRINVGQEVKINLYVETTSPLRQQSPSIKILD